MRDSELIKKDIKQFLQLCVNYSTDSLKRKLERRENMNEQEIKDIDCEIEKWENYKEFTEYTIDEIENGKLDHWIENLHNTNFQPTPHDS